MELTFPMALPYGRPEGRGRRSNWRHPSLPPIMATPSSQQRDRHGNRSSFSATPPPREESVNLLSFHLPFSSGPLPSDQRQSLPSVQELQLGMIPSPSLNHLPPIMSSPHSSGTPPQNEASTPRTRDSPVEEPVAGPSGSRTLGASSSGSGKLSNRSYYPASYHQHQFDALALHDRMSFKY